MGLWQNLINKIKDGSWRDIDPSMIIEGCTNHFLGDILNDKEKQDKIKKLATYRINICNKCPMNEEGNCDNSGDIMIEHVITKQKVKGCGCGLSCKTSSPDAMCPAGKWISVKI
jgi:hypothetical protein